MEFARAWLACITLYGLFCSAAAIAKPEYQLAAEIDVIDIALAGNVTSREAELSALAWCDQELWMVPQYLNFTDRNNSKVGHLYRLTRKQIIRYLSALRSGDSPVPLQPDEIKVTGLHRLEGLRGYQGVEAFACEGSEGFFAVEINRWGRREATVLAKVINEAGHWRIESVSQRLLSSTNIPNKGNEALVIAPQGLLSLHEVNAESLQIAGKPSAVLVDKNLQKTNSVGMDAIPYRVTDATELDQNNRFWVVNYLWSGDTPLHQASDRFWQKHGRGKSHANVNNVERLIELEWTGSDVKLTGRAPVDLRLPGQAGRNWEGVVRLDNQGFLLVTDKHPSTMLGFVPYSSHD